MVLSSQQGWDWPSAIQMALVFTQACEPQEETSEKQLWRETEAEGTADRVTAESAE